MRAIFHVLGDNKAISAAEIKSTLEAEGIKYKILSGKDFFFDVMCDVGKLRSVGARLGLSRGVYWVIGWTSYDDITNALLAVLEENTDIILPIFSSLPRKSFAIKCVSQPGFCSVKRMEIEHLLGKKVKEIVPSATVDLRNAEVVITPIFGERVYLGIRVVAIDRKKFEERAHDKRPFSLPVSLHPKFARALVNLARTKRGEVFLDPFCGTGAIVMEAALVGARAYGCDINEAMVHGARANLEHFGVKAQVFRCDACSMAEVFDEVHAIATDPPYGRSSSTYGRDMLQLYAEFFDVASATLAREKYLAIVLCDEKLVELGKEYMRLVEVYRHRVHKSLTRYFCVYRVQ